MIKKFAFILFDLLAVFQMLKRKKRKAQKFDFNQFDLHETFEK